MSKNYNQGIDDGLETSKSFIKYQEHLYSSQEVVNSKVRSRLEDIKNTHVHTDGHDWLEGYLHGMQKTLTNYLKEKKQ